MERAGKGLKASEVGEGKEAKEKEKEHERGGEKTGSGCFVDAAKTSD